MRLVLVLMLCLVAYPVHGDDPVPAVSPFPKIASAAEPDPVPVSPDTVPVVSPGTIYIVQSDAAFMLLSSPSKIVSVMYDQGPMKIRGVFADGSGKVETRTYQNKFIAVVDAIDGATGRVELLFVPSGVTEENSIQRMLIDIGAAPQPPPIPEPKPIPTPDPKPHPVLTGFRALIIHESSEAYSREQLNILNSPAIYAYLNTHCIKNGSVPEWRKWDKDVVLGANESPALKQLWADSKAKIGKLPQLVIATNSQAKYYDLPATEADTLTLLKSIGGN
jgi:hypothetical protein